MPQPFQALTTSTRSKGPVIMAPNFELILILRETLYRIEKESSRNDPAVDKLKRTILLAIAELEAAKEKDKGAAA
jgi:hypothetical protein